MRKEELYAKEIMAALVDRKYLKLQKGESPDWFCVECDYGLEVVIAENQKQIKLSKSLKKVKMSKGETENLVELGTKTDYGFISHVIFQPDLKYYDLLVKVIKEKNKKLNEMYNKYLTNDLFIFASDPLMGDDDILGLIPKIIQENSFNFDNLILYTGNGTLTIFNVTTLEISKYPQK